MYRITRTTMYGQFANDRCFLDWMATYPESVAHIVDFIEEPATSGEPYDANTRRLYIWKQDGDVHPAKMVCSYKPDLVNDGKRNGWPTFAEARAVVEGARKKAVATDAMVAAANKEAVSVGKIVGDIPKDAAKAVADAASGNAIGTVGKVAAAVAAVLVGIWIFKK